MKFLILDLSARLGGLFFLCCVCGLVVKIGRRLLRIRNGRIGLIWIVVRLLGVEGFCVRD